LNNELKQKAGLVYNIVESVILAMSVGLMVWLANVVIEHGQKLSSITTQASGVDVRVTRLEVAGSTSLQSHEKEDDQRVSDIKDRLARLESAVIVLQATPGELKAIGVTLSTMHESQKRIEERLDKMGAK
jgi:hypothetical protein